MPLLCEDLGIFNECIPKVHAFPGHNFNCQESRNNHTHLLHLTQMISYEASPQLLKLAGEVFLSPFSLMRKVMLRVKQLAQGLYL